MSDHLDSNTKKYVLIVNIAGDWYGSYHRRDYVLAFAENANIERVYVIGIPADFFHAPIKKLFRLKHAFKSFFKTDKYDDKIRIYTPIIFIHYMVGFKIKFLRKINKLMFLNSLEKLIERENIDSNILYSVYRPELIDFIDFNRDFKVIYDCYDEYLISSNDKQIKYLNKVEMELFKLSDYIFTTATKLKEKALMYNKNSYFIPNAANVSIFEKAFSENLEIPQDLKYIKPPIIGYIGVFRNWIDYDLLNFLFEHNPDKSFVFIGNWLKHADKVVKRFSEFPNVFFLGRKKLEQIPAYLKYIDIALIPNKINKFNQNVLPYKLYEYLAAGKKIVSTNTSDDLNKYYGEYIEIANSYSEFSGKIESLLNNNSFNHKKVFEFGIKQSWQHRVKEIMDIIN